MRLLLVGINAKYIHSNPAIRILAEYVKRRLPVEPELLECTINQYTDDILRAIYEKQPDVIGFSCYIWNIQMVKAVLPAIRKILPDCTLFAGGPEVSFGSTAFLQENTLDFIIRGEGEIPLTEAMCRLLSGESYEDVRGLTVRLADGRIQENPDADVPDMSEVPFPYTELDSLKNRIIYYETMRGCPFHCQYCLSGGGSKVRFRPLPMVFKELDLFLSQRIPQVKFMDRTFNCNREYAMEIWKYLSEHDNGVTNFHFEMAAELLDEEMVRWLHTVRKGLFQFEIGVQSTNPDTLRAVQRVTLPEKLTPIIRALQKGQNIHLHLDLIAGLPFESYDRFGESYNYVYSLHPDQLQLGFLKLLKGSGLEQKQQEYGLVCRDDAPYEILCTPWLSYSDVLRLKRIEALNELYYNSLRYQRELSFLVERFSSPFRFFESLSGFFEENGFFSAPLAKMDTYTALYRFVREKGLDAERFSWLARYDMFAHEKVKKLPYWLSEGLKPRFHAAIYRFLDQPENRTRWLPEYEDLTDTHQLIRNVHIEVFPFDPRTGADRETALLFSYRRRTLDRNAAVFEITLSV